MAKRSPLALTVLSILATAALAVTAAEAQSGQAWGQRPQPSAPVVQQTVLSAEAPAVTVETSEVIVAAPATALSSTIAEPSLSNTPGVNRSTLPSGLQRWLDSDHSLHSGL